MATRKKEITTNFAEAWKAFHKSKQYKELAAVLGARRIGPAYIDNILHASFTAGWNATGAVIKIVSK